MFQVVTILSKDVGDENYWKGESNGRQGLFPHRFVEKEKYKTLYDFKAEDDDELNLKVGQVSFSFISEDSLLSGLFSDSFLPFR